MNTGEKHKGEKHKGEKHKGEKHKGEKHKGKMVTAACGQQGCSVRHTCRWLLTL